MRLWCNTISLLTRIHEGSGKQFVLIILSSSPSPTESYPAGPSMAVPLAASCLCICLCPLLSFVFLPSFPWNSFPKQYVPSSPLILKSLVFPLFWTEMYFQVVSVAEQLSLCIPLKCDTAVTHLACSWHQGPGLACWSFWEKTWKLAAMMLSAYIKQGIWCSASSYLIT